MMFEVAQLYLPFIIVLPRLLKSSLDYICNSSLDGGMTRSLP